MALAFGLFGCASTPEKEATPRVLYEEAIELHKQANYDGANKKFEVLISTFPTSPYSRQAMVDRVYFYYLRKKYALAVDSADRFINTHPDNPNVAYVLYMKGLSYFRDDRGILDIVGRQNPARATPNPCSCLFKPCVS